MKIKPEVGVAGHYNIVVRRADGSVKQDHGWFPNLITDVGLNNIGGSGTLVSTCFVGSGSQAPSVADTALKTPVASTTTAQGQTEGFAEAAPYYGWFRRTFRFLDGAAAGNLSEVGVGNGQDNTLFSRALILDTAGNPTTITVLGDETLDVSYEIRMYPPTADATFNLALGGVTYACRMRPSNVNSAQWSPRYFFDSGARQAYLAIPYTGDIGTTVQAPSGNSGGLTFGEILAYSNNSRKQTHKFSWDLNDGNLDGGLKSIGLFQSYPTTGAWQCSFTPVIPKDATKKLSLTFEVSWARYTPA